MKDWFKSPSWIEGKGIVSLNASLKTFRSTFLSNLFKKDDQQVIIEEENQDLKKVKKVELNFKKFVWRAPFVQNVISNKVD